MAKLGFAYNWGQQWQASLISQIAPGWSNLEQFPTAGQLPASPTEYVLLISGSVGNFSQSGCTNTAVELGVRVGAGVGAPTSGHRVIHAVADADMGPGTNRVTPFLMIVRATLSSTSQVRMVYTFRRNGDPITCSATADVFNLSIVAWNLSALGASNYYHGSVESTGTTLPLAASGSFATFEPSGTVPWSSGTENWITWHSAQVRPGRTDSTYTSFVQGWDSSGSSQLFARGQGYSGVSARVNASAQTSVYSMGLVHVDQITQANTKLRVRAQSLGTQGPEAVATRFDVFSVRGDILDNFVFDDTVATIYNASNEAVEYDEITTAAYRTNENLLAIGCAVPLRVGAVSSYGAQTTMHLNGSFPLVYAMTRNVAGLLVEEGPPQITIARAAGTVTQLVAQWGGKGNGFESSPRTTANEFALIAFAQSNDGPPVVSLPTPGAEVVVIPGKETLNLSALSALPIDPDQEIRETWIDDVTTMTTERGDKIAWPAMIVPRRQVEFSWTDITLAQLNSLLEFLDGIATMAFKWTDPTIGVSLPYVVLGRQVSGQDANGFYGLRLQTVEGVYFAA